MLHALSSLWIESAVLKSRMQRYLVIFLSIYIALASSERSFEIINDRFVKDGEPVQIFSGR